jgi:FkbM family methyltransferase
MVALISVYHIRMFARTLAGMAAKLPSSVKYRLVKLRPLYTLAMRLGQSSTIVETSVGQLRWRIDAVTSQEFLRGTYEPYMQNAFIEYVQRGNTVFDIGAHAGFHSMFCGLLVGATGRVFAFEPNPISRESLAGQIRLNRTLRLEIVPYALSDKVGLADFDATRGSQSRITSMGKCKVEMRTIDSLVSIELPIPDLIKIDVEGEEEKVLRGSVKTLSMFRPIVLCDYNDDKTLSILVENLLPLDYEVLPGPPVIGIPR